jgi:hypothetical protein
MPTRHLILESVKTIANEWAALAVAWHVLVGIALIAWLMRWRPDKRIVAPGLIALVASFGVVSALAGNPINAIAAALSVVALRFSTRGLPKGPVERGDDGATAAGWTMVVFGWAYPHFLETSSPVSYLYAAPLGLLPCPTLAMVVGLTLVVGSLGSRSWGTVLGAISLVYGLVGVLYLQVWLDVVLIAGALVLLRHALLLRTNTCRSTGSYVTAR